MQDLLVETGRVKDLYTQCHDRGIRIGDFGTAVRTTREFISNRRFLLALDRMRELKLELLAELILSDQLPPEDLVTAPGVIGSAWSQPPVDFLYSSRRLPFCHWDIFFHNHWG